MRGVVWRPAHDSRRPAPKLKDAVLGGAACDVYVECVQLVRRLYQDCHLVHGDLSEYNMLCAWNGSNCRSACARYHQGRVVVIDVSQSVEHAHPHALEFLRKDIANINGGAAPRSKCTDVAQTSF